jgi:hypothetical protein
LGVLSPPGFDATLVDFGLEDVAVDDEDVFIILLLVVLIELEISPQLVLLLI